MPQNTSILLVEDDPSMAALCQAYLSADNCQVSHAKNGTEALAALNQNIPDVMLLDLQLPDIHGSDILKTIQQKQLPIETIVITGDASVNTAVESMQLGARDFVVKPFSKDRLLTTVKNAVEHQQLTQIVQTYREEIDRQEYAGFIGSSLIMQGVYRIIDSAANTKATAFVTGESGTGKEVCAEAIHSRSSRNKKPFIAINCGAIPKDLMESEIFGHIKGAFTGALNNRSGAASLANGGTLFLDEICEMELDLQPKLLRFLQTGTFHPVGSSQEEFVDVRIICATNRSPLEEVTAGRFREDLYYRLHVLPINLPPLRERGADILQIANRFLVTYAKEENKEFSRFSSEAEAVLSQYDWPGNVRQLQNVVRNMVVLHQGDTITPDMLPAPLDQLPRNTASSKIPPVHQNVTATQVIPPSDPVQTIRPLTELEREAIEQAISICDGNIPQAAVHLGISAATVYRKKAAWQND